MARQGLNTTLSYMRGKERRAYKVRANLITHGVTVLYDESASRIRRAFYPHRLTSAQFTIGIQLNGDEEFRSFSSWMANYVDYLLDPNLAFDLFPVMTVAIPSKSKNPSEDFLRDGVPMSGFEWGDHVGAMVWQPQVVFESAGEHGIVPKLSRVEGLSAIADKNVRYFYPTGTQLNGNQAPSNDSYNRVITISDMTEETEPEFDEGLIDGIDLGNRPLYLLPQSEMKGPLKPIGPGNWIDPSEVL